ncbi:MAG: hypothetical protein IPH96_17935 [Saprospiraceae bacterium]|nr:hypothetical protein [Saprospiraceae bacterium]
MAVEKQIRISSIYSLYFKLIREHAANALHLSSKDKIRISYDKIYSPETEIEYLPLQISNEQSDELEATPVDETNINLNAPSYLEV